MGTWTVRSFFRRFGQGPASRTRQSTSIRQRGGDLGASMSGERSASKRSSKGSSRRAGSVAELVQSVFLLSRVAGVELASVRSLEDGSSTCQAQVEESIGTKWRAACRNGRGSTSHDNLAWLTRSRESEAKMPCTILPIYSYSTTLSEHDEARPMQTECLTDMTIEGVSSTI